MHESFNKKYRGLWRLKVSAKLQHNRPRVIYQAPDHWPRSMSQNHSCRLQYHEEDPGFVAKSRVHRLLWQEVLVDNLLEASKN